MKEREQLRARVAVGERGERLAVRLSEPEEAPAELAILYLHGFGSTQAGEKAEYFRARAVEAGVAFCSFDFRGHGRSEGSMRELTFARTLEDVAAVRAWLAGRGYRRVALFGSSMGGATALWHAAEQPAGVVAGVHIAPAVAMGRGLERWAGEAGLERWRREGVLRYRSELVDCDLGWEIVEDLRSRDFDALAERTVTPMLLFQGQRDDAVEWRDVERFARRAPPGRVELVLFADGDHRLTDRKPELWRRALAFLRRREAA
jgi:pimeloyl-ACP methyl ester carboxylesterase